MPEVAAKARTQLKTILRQQRAAQADIDAATAYGHDAELGDDGLIREFIDINGSRYTFQYAPGERPSPDAMYDNVSFMNEYEYRSRDDRYAQDSTGNYQLRPEFSQPVQSAADTLAVYRDSDGVMRTLPDAAGGSFIYDPAATREASPEHLAVLRANNAELVRLRNAEQALLDQPEWEAFKRGAGDQVRADNLNNMTYLSPALISKEQGDQINGVWTVVDTAGSGIEMLNRASVSSTTSTRYSVTTSDRTALRAPVGLDVDSIKISDMGHLAIEPNDDRFVKGAINKLENVTGATINPSPGVSYNVGEVETQKIGHTTFSHTPVTENVTSTARVVNSPALDAVGQFGKYLPVIGGTIKSGINYAETPNDASSWREELVAGADFVMYTANDVLSGSVAVVGGAGAAVLSTVAFSWTGPAAPVIGVTTGVGAGVAIDYTVGNWLDDLYEDNLRPLFAK